MTTDLAEKLNLLCSKCNDMQYYSNNVRNINRADSGLPHISARILQVTACPSSKDLLDDEQGYFRHMALSPYSIANI